MKLIIEEKDREKIMKACTAKVTPIECIEECGQCPLMQIINEICARMCGVPYVNLETGETTKEEPLANLPLKLSTLD